MTLRESLAYEPVELSFGTSGLRGLVRDITQLEAALTTRAFLQFALASGDVKAGDAVCIAGDLRPSTDTRVEAEGGRGAILQAVAWGIQDAGLRVWNLGHIPTPALMYFAMQRGLASVMVTGSHIPFDRNGMKFNRPAGELLKTDEQPILAAVRALRAREYARPARESPFDPRGMLRTEQAPSLPATDPAAAHEYTGRYRSAFPGGSLRGRRLLVYQHSAVARDLLVEILQELGAEVVPAGRSEQFIPIDTEAVSERMLAEIQQLADDAGGGFDAVVSTDGDGDRPLVLGVERGRVRFFSGDLLGLVVAGLLAVKHVAVPVNANDAVDRFCAARGVALTRTRIGSPYVVAAMREVGWEANGGFLTACPLRVPGGGELAPLPTRDAFLPILATLHAAFGGGRSLCEHLATLPQRFGRSGLVRPFARETSLRILARFTPSDAGIEQAEFRGEGVFVRHAGTPPRSLAGSDPAGPELVEIKARLETRFTGSCGFGGVAWINYLDGVRVGFTNGDIAHLRPSGNAPELRLYACADTQERADEIVRLGASEGGILQRLAAEAEPG